VEYGVLPVDPNLLDAGQPDQVYEETNWQVFRQLVKGGSENVRNIVFFDPDEFPRGENRELLDPWGEPYRVTLDTNGNNSPLGGSKVQASK
jgi:hypothetical protein